MMMLEGNYLIRKLLYHLDSFFKVNVECMIEIKRDSFSW